MPPPSPPTLGILCALAGELGTLGERRVGSQVVHGSEILELDLGGCQALAVVSGIGAARAAHAASALMAAGVERALLIVGTCGALARDLEPGAWVHCTTARASSRENSRSADEGSEVEANSALREQWQQIAAGTAARYLTVDRAVLSHWRRYLLRRAHPDVGVVEMETAAAARVARAANVPWAALRTVTDRAGFGARKSFRHHFPVHGGKAAETLPALARAIS